MPDFYLDTHVGVKDNTKIPADKSDGRKVGAVDRRIIGSKPTGVAWANADQIYLGTLQPGETLREILLTSDTSLGTTTLSVGPKTATTKYANARTMTTTDVPTIIGPRATAADDAPLTAAEDIWLTLGVGGVASGVVLTIELVFAGIK
jgi:hypothetical protein